MSELTLSGETIWGSWYENTEKMCWLFDFCWRSSWLDICCSTCLC